MKYTFASELSNDMYNYLKLLDSSEQSALHIRSTLTSLDKYLITNEYRKRELTEESIIGWLKASDIGSMTKTTCLSRIRGFVKYLNSLGVSAQCPEYPRAASDYVPYIFSEGELNAIFTAADNFMANKQITHSATIFPFLLRLLYGCGLRLGEGISLRWKDVDLESGVLTIRKAKSLKERFVPMDASTTKMLKIFRNMVFYQNICHDYLFESNIKSGNHFTHMAFQLWFKAVLDAANVIHIELDRHRRGICPHCLRHTFTHNSFLKSEQNGRRFEDTAPFLSAYLGHDSLQETEAYLSANYSIYTKSHQRISDEIENLFPEVCFDEN